MISIPFYDASMYETSFKEVPLLSHMMHHNPAYVGCCVPPLPININDELLPKYSRYIETRSLQKRIYHTMLSMTRDLACALRSVPSRILTLFNFIPYKEYCQPSKPSTWNQWNNSSSGLYVYNHGFQGHPSIWNRYITSIKKTDPHADVRVPFIPHRGNCSLEIATDPIRDMIKNYIESQMETKGRHEKIKVSLNGVSNGGRITLNILNGLVDANLNTRLKEKGIKLALQVNSIAGALHGSTCWRARLANYSRPIRWFAQTVLRTSPHIISDLSYKSAATTAMIDKIRNINEKALSNIEISYAFFATTEDGVVTPYTSSLPVLGKYELHHIVHAEGHSSIVDRVRDYILNTN